MLKSSGVFEGVGGSVSIISETDVIKFSVNSVGEQCKIHGVS